MAAKDMASTLALIHDFWPDFAISKEDFQSPTTEFVIRFFTNFITELNDTLACLTGEESVNDSNDSPIEFGREVSLYCRITKILRKMNYTNFNLNDIFCPHSKRIHPVVKYCIHFLIYVNNGLDDITNNSNEIYKKIEESDHLNNLKQQCLQETANNAENIARGNHSRESLKKKLEAVEKRHGKMLQDKVNKEKINFEKSTEKNNLQNENDRLDYKLYDLVCKERDLQERLVTEEEHDSLKNSSKYLEVEQEEVCKEITSIESELDKQTEMIEYIEEYTKELKCLNFDVLNVDILNGLEKEEKSLQTFNMEINTEIKTLNDDKTTKISNFKKKMQAEEEVKMLFQNYEAKATQDMEECKKLYESKSAQFSIDFEESQRLKTQIMNTQESIEKIEEEEKLLKKFAIRNYKRVLMTNAKTTNKMHSMLLCLKSPIDKERQ